VQGENHPTGDKKNKTRRVYMKNAARLYPQKKPPYEENGGKSLVLPLVEPETVGANVKPEVLAVVYEQKHFSLFTSPFSL